MTTRGVILGRVVKVRDHPRGSRIWLADVRLGPGDATVQIVFGGLGKVVQPGCLVPVAPPGSRLPDPGKANGRKMRRRTYRGETSYGMLCSLAELGWDLTATKQVAIFRDESMEPGDSLDGIGSEWPSLVLLPVPDGPAEFQPGRGGLDELPLGEYEPARMPGGALTGAPV